MTDPSTERWGLHSCHQSTSEVTLHDNEAYVGGGNTTSAASVGTYIPVLASYLRATALGAMLWGGPCRVALATWGAAEEQCVCQGRPSALSILPYRQVGADSEEGLSSGGPLSECTFCGPWAGR